ncbi:MAG: hypothetical protein WC322_05710 [Candidatus Paceibacterota bacterium]
MQVFKSGELLLEDCDAVRVKTRFNSVIVWTLWDDDTFIQWHYPWPDEIRIERNR